MESPLIAARFAEQATEKHKLTEARVAKLEADAAAMESSFLAKLGEEEAMVAALEARKEKLVRQLVVLGFQGSKHGRGEENPQDHTRQRG